MVGKTQDGAPTRLTYAYRYRLARRYSLLHLKSVLLSHLFTGAGLSHLYRSLNFVLPDSHDKMKTKLHQPFNEHRVVNPRPFADPQFFAVSEQLNTKSNRSLTRLGMVFHARKCTLGPTRSRWDDR